MPCSSRPEQQSTQAASCCLTPPTHLGCGPPYYSSFSNTLTGDDQIAWMEAAFLDDCCCCFLLGHRPPRRWRWSLMRDRMVKSSVSPPPDWRDLTEMSRNVGTVFDWTARWFLQTSQTTAISAQPHGLVPLEEARKTQLASYMEKHSLLLCVLEKCVQQQDLLIFTHCFFRITS